MPVTVEIFSQGEEIVTGQVIDSNAAWLGQQLTQMGFLVTRHSSVGDKLDDLVALLTEISARADCCICTGGLGPTVDDLTAEAVAQAFTLKLETDVCALQQIEQYFLNRKRPMPNSNRKQALLPQDSVRLDNDWGTAPGFALRIGRCWFAFVPGVPYEMRHMFQARIIPHLKQQFSVKACQLLTVKTVGIGESDIQQCLQNMTVPKTIQLSFRADPEEVQTKLLFSPDTPEAEIKSFAQQVVALIGDFVFSIEFPGEQSTDMVSVISDQMTQRQLTLSIVDCFSHGLIAAKCVGQQWVSNAYYDHSITKLCKTQNIEPDSDLLATGIKIAEANRRRNQTDFALVQLVDTNESALHDKNQAMTLYHVLATENSTLTRIRHVSGPSKRKYNQAAVLALDLIRRCLQEKPI